MPPVSVVNTHGTVGQNPTFLIGPRHALPEDTKCVSLNPLLFQRPGSKAGKKGAWIQDEWAR